MALYTSKRAALLAVLALTVVCLVFKVFPLQIQLPQGTSNSAANINFDKNQQKKELAAGVPTTQDDQTIRQPHESINSGLPKVSNLSREMPRTLGRYTIPHNIDIAEWKTTLETYLKLPVDKLYGSHAIPLLAAAYLTEGNYLELGTGFFSTPIFHKLAKIRQHRVTSAESDPEWILKLKDFKDSFHDVFYIKTKGNFKKPAPEEFIHKDGWISVGGDTHWGMIFVDHARGARRAVDLERLRDQGDIIVIHDSQPKMNNFYKTQPPLQRFKYRYSFAHHSYFRASTDLVTNSRPDLLMMIRSLAEYTIRYLEYIPVEP